MAEIHVFVWYDDRQGAVTVDHLEHRVRRAHPRWLVQRFPISPAPLAVGRYDWAPISVYLNADDSVAEEAHQTAHDMRGQGADAALITAVHAATARFEIIWDLSADEDLVPETSEVVSAIAQEAMALTGGVALRGATPFICGDITVVWDQLFPS